jgi:glycosyltransferase involved in cell wall biosynthesis
MVAPPWIRLPPVGYGGVEFILSSLVEELTKLGHTVDVFTVGDSVVPRATLHWQFPVGQYQHIFDPLYDVAAIPIAHLLMARRIIGEHGGFDLVHDHNYLLGPAVLAHGNSTSPPVLHTLHGPFYGPSANGPASNLEAYCEFAHDCRLWFNGVSRAQLRSAPALLIPKLLGVVHNSLDLLNYPFSREPEDFFLTLARFSPEKGHDVAARLCRQAGARLLMAGSIGNVSSSGELAAVLADPTSPHWLNRELRHFHADVRPHLEPGLVEYVGAAHGDDKIALLRRSRALLLPIDWEEPFGVAAVEAMACGTPVVAFARGALPELIEHGVNGFLAETEAEFLACMKLVDEIDPSRCRALAEERFSAVMMASKYVEIYEKVLQAAP